MDVLPINHYYYYYYHYYYYYYYYYYYHYYYYYYDSVLNFIASTLACVKNSKIYVDLPGFLSPSVLTGDSLRPDLLLKVENKCLYILELTVGFESNLQVNARRKHHKYLGLIKELETAYDKVKFVNLSLSTLGIFSQSVENFDDMLSVSKFDTQDSKFIKRKIMNICIRTSYYIFCKRNKEWDNPKIMTL